MNSGLHMTTFPSLHATYGIMFLIMQASYFL
jgi:hypothetical protein